MDGALFQSAEEKDGIDIRQETATRQESAAKGARGRPAAVLAAAGAIVALMAAAVVAAGIYVRNLETIYPHVSAGGVDLSGMTVEEAERALVEAGYEDRAGNVAVTVNFPDGEKMTISGEDIGLPLRAGDAARAAYGFGRQGTFFENLWTYLKCVFARGQLDGIGAAGIDEGYVRSAVEEQVRRFNEKLVKSAYTITDDAVLITKGGGGSLADAGELTEAVISAIRQSFEQSRPVTFNYSVGTGGGGDIDLKAIYDSVHVEPADAVYDKKAKQIKSSVEGVSFDLEAARAALEKAPAGSTVRIPLIKTQPHVTTQALEKLMFRDILSERTTYVAGTKNRVHNVTLAASAINETILNPGETFSYNMALGERTPEKGYSEASAYVGGKVVQEIGGGICQVSSTLYCCVLYADLEVVERANHMFIVTYLPLGVDATVNWGTVDFKFKNSTEYPIKIESYVENNYLTVRLYGTKTSENTIKIESVVVKKTDFKTVQREDPTVPPGTTREETDGHPGYVVDTYKYVYDPAGNLLSKTFIARSTYRVQDKIVLVPVGTLTPSPSPSPAEEAGGESPATSASPGI